MVYLSIVEYSSLDFYEYLRSVSLASSFGFDFDFTFFKWFGCALDDECDSSLKVEEFESPQMADASSESMDFSLPLGSVSGLVVSCTHYRRFSYRQAIAGSGRFHRVQVALF